LGERESRGEGWNIYFVPPVMSRNVELRTQNTTRNISSSVLLLHKPVHTKATYRIVSEVSCMSDTIKFTIYRPPRA
jgi:hypothetical protein